MRSESVGLVSRQMTMLRECPECLQGKHVNCTGQTLTSTDEWVDCSCANRDHLTVNQWIERHSSPLAGLPVLPYAGTSGYSGSDTSEERARTEDANGTTSERQTRLLRILEQKGHAGETVLELRQATGWHHGRASAVLSVLHKEGLIERLSERRERCKVYVVPEFVDGRETEQHGRKTSQDADKLAAIQEYLDRWKGHASPIIRVITEDVQNILNGDQS